MKTAQDISPSAIVCLALGLLIANTLVPERKKFQYASNWLPKQEATSVSLSEGRLLERSPENSESSIANTPENVPSSQGNETSMQELRDAFQQRTTEKPPTMSDSSVYMMTVVFILFGVAASYTDVIEFSTEKGASDTVTENAKEKNVRDADLRRHPKPVVLIAAVLMSAIGFLCWACLSAAATQDSFGEDLSEQELRKLDIMSRKQLTAFLPDSLVILLVGVFTVVAPFVMKADICEMREELQKTPKCKVDMERPARASPPSSSRFLYVAVVSAVMASIGMLLWHTSLLAASLNGWAIAELIDGSCNALLDFALELFLGVCTVLGLAVMRVDIREMVEQVRDESGPRMATSSPSRLAEKLKAA